MMFTFFPRRSVTCLLHANETDLYFKSNLTRDIITCRSVRLEKGDRLLLYKDGIIEGREIPRGPMHFHQQPLQSLQAERFPDAPMPKIIRHGLRVGLLLCQPALIAWVPGRLLAYHLDAHGLTLAALPSALSLPLLRLAGSGVIPVVLTTAGMLIAMAKHPPACATTLIVSLGLLATFWDAIFIMLAVAVMYAVHMLLPPNRPDTVREKK